MEEKQHMPGRSFWQTTFSRHYTATRQLMNPMLRHVWSIQNLAGRAMKVISIQILCILLQCLGGLECVDTGWIVCYIGRRAAMDADVAPAKRLRFSPESKHAPRPKSDFDEQEQHRTNSAETPAALSPSRSSNSAGTCVQSDAASEQYCAAQSGLISGSTKALRASAAPWTPAKLIPQSNPLQSSQTWQSLYGPSIFGSALAATDYETDIGPGVALSSYTGQV